MKDKVICMICGKSFRQITYKHLKHHNLTVEGYKNKYPESDMYCEETINSSKITKENCVLKYGEEEGIRKWNSYRHKQSISNSYEYKHKKYGWTKEQFEEFNKNRGITKRLCIKRHGKKEGLMIWDSYVNKQIVTKSKEYVVNKYGADRWRNINELKRQDLNNFIKRHGKKGYEKWKKYCESNRFFGCKSLLEKEFSKKIQELFPHKFSNTGYVGDMKRYFFIDILYKNKGIEFYGDYWHANPNKYTENFKFNFINGLSTAKDIWNKDKERISHIGKLGVDVLIVWEHDYRKNPEKEIIRGLKWMNS